MKFKILPRKYKAGDYINTRFGNRRIIEINYKGNSLFTTIDENCRNLENNFKSIDELMDKYHEATLIEEEIYKPIMFEVGDTFVVDIGNELGVRRVVGMSQSYCILDVATGKVVTAAYPTIGNAMLFYNGCIVNKVKLENIDVDGTYLYRAIGVVRY